MKLKSLTDRLGKVLIKDGVDLKQRATEAGQKVAAGWEWASEKAESLASVLTHEERLRKVEEDTGELARDVRDLKIWIADIDNRTQLLEHYHDYDLDDIRCVECGSPMRVKRNRSTGQFFFGCSKHRLDRTGCNHTRPISQPHLEVLAERYLNK